MFGLMLKKTHCKKVDWLNQVISGLKIEKKFCEDLLIEKNNKILDFEKYRAKSIRIEDNDTRLNIQAMLDGFYTYEVWEDGKYIKSVKVPKSSKNCDYLAKKLAGYTSNNMKGVKAVRWTP